MKKLMKVLLAALLLVSISAVSVCAEGSPLRFGAIGDWQAFDENGNEYSHDEYYLTFQPVELHHTHGSDQALYDFIHAVNNGEKTISDYLANVGKRPGNAGDIVLFAPILDLTVKRKSDDQDVDAFRVTVTFEVPNLLEGNGTVYVYHHSTLTGKDELITPTKVDYENKAITVTFPDLSPVSVVGIKYVQKPVDTSTKDYTSLFAGLALIAAGALIAINKKEKTAA